MYFLKLILRFFCISIYLVSHASHSTNIGVYYYPGWKKPKIDAWSKIKNYPEREPILGWYREGESNITKDHLKWMRKYGVDFVVYDWYWDKKSGVENRTYAIDSYLKNSQGAGVKFAILWANHTGTPESIEQFDKIVDYWIEHYFTNKNYEQYEGKPVVYIFSPQSLAKDAAAFKSTPNELLNRARDKALKAGLKGLYFVGSVDANEDAIITKLPNDTYDALSAYNYHVGVEQGTGKLVKMSKNYGELTAGYKWTWEFILKNSKLPYIIPVTSGWDRRPWGGSADPEHDESYSTPDQFYNHLLDAKYMLTANPNKTIDTVIICCWNEYGEGSYIEPTKKYGFSYLEKISEVFKDK
ncbi:glycoside hydrolase family 99-like domain-containing protein [Serratia fonticola]|uniref:glycoside hydrolase family 99-like domain-containing protein n=1 Tax=Serratia fonticola TaxID=47917 RepID=UPI00192CB308|nr:glycoside hydrolase family 99-like domain-containing protein [Serratia fonticola]